MMAARRLSILLCAAGLLLAAPAYAGEPSAADSETALQLYKDGKALRDQGDARGALEKLRAAYALVETPITALELGRTYIAVGQLLEARGVLGSVSRIPVRNNESAKAGEARIEAESLAAELRPRLASLSVRPKGVVAGNSAPRITIDNVTLPPEAASAPRVLNPGAHVVVVEANGQRVQSDISLAEGQTAELDVEIPPAKPEPVTPPPPTTEPPPPVEDRKLSPLVYAGFGAGAVGIGVGTVTGILTLSKASALKDACRDKQCPASSQSDIDSASTTGAISTVSFVIGGVGIAVGVVGLFMGGGRSEAPRASGLRIVPTANGVGGTF